MPRPDHLAQPLSNRKTLTRAAIGERIRSERRRLKLSQEEAAARLDISRSTYRQLEKGTDPQLSTLLALADAGFRLRALAIEIFNMDGCEGWRYEVYAEASQRNGHIGHTRVTYRDLDGDDRPELGDDVAQEPA